MAEIDALAYSTTALITSVKRFTVQSPVTYTMKLITDIHNKLECFVPGKSFQPSPMFAGKAGAYPRVDHLKGLARKH